MKHWDEWGKVKKELLSDPEVKKEYDRLAPEYAVISQLIEIRAKKGLTQKALAKKLGTKQSAIARLESGNGNPTLLFLQKTAKALGRKLTISFE
jgi:ribosome-binding protein aMBF1 (putative translation factor)